MARRASDNATRSRILQFIHDFIESKGYSPSLRDIVRGCSLSSTAVVQHHLKMLEKQGILHRDPDIFRSIQLTEKDDSASVPLLGIIAAGNPIPVPRTESWINDAWETIDLPKHMKKGKNVFALRVKGQSMIDALIADGDIVLMQAVNSADNGEMVAVWLKDRGEVTLKKIYYENNMVRLQPANEQMKPIIVDPAVVEIQGKVIGVLRSLL
jgi:repressor LexA